MTDRPSINPALQLKPVWIDEAYLNRGKAEKYVPNWVSITPDQVEKYSAQCDRLSPNQQGALFGYKGTYFKDGIDCPRNVLCVSTDKSQAWVDKTAFLEI